MSYVMEHSGHADRQALGRVQSLDRGLAILRIIADSPRPMTVGALARELGVSASAVSRLAATLRDHGLVEQSAIGGPYTLGLSLLRYARAVSHEHPSALLGTRADELARVLGETISVAVPVEDGVLYIRCTPPPGRVVQIRVQVGAVLPYHSTATGKVFLAEMSEDEVSDVIARGLTRRTPNTITNPSRLLAELQEVRDQGYAVERGESDAAVGCIAVPVRGVQPGSIAALSCSIGVKFLSPARIERIRAELQAAAYVLTDECT